MLRPPTVLSLQHVRRCFRLLMYPAIALVFSFLLLGSGATASTGSEGICRNHSEPRPASAIVRRPYDVLRYDLVLDWRTPLSDSSQQARSYRARQTITLRADSAQLRRIEFDAASALAIDTVRVRRTGLQWQQITTISHDGDVLAIELPSLLSAGDTLTVEINYRNLSTASQRNEFYGGYNRYWRDERDSLLPAPLAYTMSQPNNARRWMPCNDRPYDKALATVTILAPPGFTTLSNGAREPITIEFGGEQVAALRYSSTEPIATYLMVAIASRFAEMETAYRSRDSLRTIPLRLYLWHSDSAAYADNAAWMLAATAEMMKAYEHYFVPYPFGSYGQALLYPYFMGAMEHQTMTTHHRNALVQRWETVVAHELAHHWLGDLVTCATWNDIWLNEGGATYSERLWIESAYGDTAARRYFAQRRDRDYLRSDGARSQPPVYNTSGTNLFNTGTTYVKAGWIYHMMRTMLGDSMFFAVMRAYLERFAHRTLETDDMRAFFEQLVPNPPVPWGTFFDQWVYSVGHPRLRADLLSIEEHDARWRVRVRIVQTQDAPFLPVYVVPLPLRLHEYWSGAPLDTTILVTERQQVAVLDVPFLPRTLDLDPDETILCEKDTSTLVLSIEPTIEQRAMAIFPNPVQRGDAITVWLGSGSMPAGVTMWSSDGRRVFDCTAHTELIEIPTAGLAAGVYAVEIACGHRRLCRTVVVLP